MPKKHHPMFQAPTGAVFAIPIEAGQWGIVRFFRGLSMGILDVVCNRPALPPLDWNNPPIKWVFFSFAPNNDSTKAVHLGVVPFANADSEWAPPCYDPPDVITNCYRIHHRGGISKTKDESDVRGMDRCHTKTPAKLAQFLKERLMSGELRFIHVKETTG